MKALLDSSILIDHLNGIPEATETIKAYDGCISSVTLGEVAAEGDTREELLNFLQIFEVIDIDLETYKQAYQLQQVKDLNLTDALVYATARSKELMLVTRNDRAYSADWLDVKIAYRV